MKVVASLTILLGSVSAFAPSHKACERMAALEAQPSRKAFLSQAVGVVAAFVASPYPATAAKYGSVGAGSSAVLDPTQAEVDEDILKSSAVQGALSKVKGYQSTVQSMKAGLDADPQLNIKPAIIKELDFASLRDTLNTLNTAFEEDTQRGTDRLIRVILQDITELETANAQKDGVPRSPRRLEIMYGKLDKLDKAFGDYLAFAN